MRCPAAAGPRSASNSYFAFFAPRGAGPASVAYAHGSRTQSRSPGAAREQANAAPPASAGHGPSPRVVCPAGSGRIGRRVCVLFPASSARAIAALKLIGRPGGMLAAAFAFASARTARGFAGGDSPRTARPNASVSASRTRRSAGPCSNAGEFAIVAPHWPLQKPTPRGIVQDMIDPRPPRINPPRRLPRVLRLGLLLSAVLFAVAGFVAVSETVALTGCVRFTRADVDAGDAGDANAAVTTETRSLDLVAVTGVDLAGSLDVVVKVDPAAAPSLTVTAESRLMPQIVTEVNGNVLGVSTRGSFRTRRPMRVSVTLPAISRANLNGSGNFDVKGACKADSFDAGLAGSGNLKIIDLQAGTLDADLRGSGNLTVAGTANRASVTVAGSGDVAADKLAAGDVTVRLSGSGDVAVRANGNADLSVSGSGDIVCAGGPRSVKKHVAGSGDISVR